MLILTMYNKLCLPAVREPYLEYREHDKQDFVCHEAKNRTNEYQQRVSHVVSGDLNRLTDMHIKTSSSNINVTYIIYMYNRTLHMGEKSIPTLHMGVVSHWSL